MKLIVFVPLMFLFLSFGARAANDCENCTIEQMDTIIADVQKYVTQWEELMTDIAEIAPDYYASVDMYNKKSAEIVERSNNVKTQNELDALNSEYRILTTNFCKVEYDLASKKYDMKVDALKLNVRGLKYLVEDHNLYNFGNRYSDLGDFEGGRRSKDLNSYTSNILMGAGNYQALAKIHGVKNYLIELEDNKKVIFEGAEEFCKPYLED